MDEDKKTAMQMAMEQGEEGLKQTAIVYGSYFKALRDNGFTRDEAFTLVLAFQAAGLKDTESSS